MSSPAVSRAATIEVELCWVAEGGAKAPQVCIERLRLPARATVADALSASNRPELSIRLANGLLAAAVFGEAVTRESPLHPGDRIELLAPLVVDPKHSRARRAEVQRHRRGDARWQRR
jgi:putative ubiquitin-RnfH superfamily antitoxin RatB of RatAB toxin-antitoxin module